jgi:hypothetical protein
MLSLFDRNIRYDKINPASMPCPFFIIIIVIWRFNSHESTIIIRSVKLSTIGRGQYLDGWPIEGPRSVVNFLNLN